jgi:hypothetical protein
MDFPGSAKMGICYASICRTIAADKSGKSPMLIKAKRGRWHELVNKNLERVPADKAGHYEGPLPSFQCQSFIRNLEEQHREWQQRRAAIKGWVYDPATGNAEPEATPAPRKRVRDLQAA